MKDILRVLPILLALGFSIVATFVIYDKAKELIKQTEEREEYLGEKYVLNGDTLTIVDYSSWDSNYKLSNGAAVHYKLILKKTNQ